MGRLAMGWLNGPRNGMASDELLAMGWLAMGRLGDTMDLTMGWLAMDCSRWDGSPC